MANKVLTFVDASVLIYAATKPTSETLARRLRALQLLGDPDREFISSEFLKLEILPIPLHYQKQREVAFYNKFFSGITKWAECATLIPIAYQIAADHGLGALDALHVAAAASFNAELVSAEKTTKPLYRAYKNITSIH